MDEQVFRILSMVLFIAYPSISVKIFRLFRCIPVEGKFWLVADMRLQCFTPRWVGYAVYGLVMAVVYVLGLPVLTIVLLQRHRATLFGPRSETTVKRFGFLYHRSGGMSVHAHGHTTPHWPPPLHFPTHAAVPTPLPLIIPLPCILAE